MCLGIERNLIIGTTSSAAPKETFIVLYQKNDQFTGRHGFLDQLATKLWENDSPKFSYRIVLHGLGGIGKTQIALRYAHTHREKYGNVFWVSAVSEATILTGFQEIGKHTGCVENIEKLEPTEIAARVLNWMNSQKQWLLVFDNLELDDSVVKKFLPHPSSLKHMLMTTRNRHCDISAEKFEVAVLQLDEAVELLLTRSNITDTTEAREEATSVVKLLGNLPLAIEQAAAYIREVSKDIFKFMKRYTEARLLFDKKPQKGIRDYEGSVATTWSLSFSQIEKTNTDASTLMRLTAFLDPDGILIEFLEAGRNGVTEQVQQFLPDSERFDRALGDLERFSLIKRQGTGKESIVVIHRLVQDVVIDEMSPEIRSDMTGVMIGLSDSAFPHWKSTRTIDNEDRLRCRKYQDQVLAMLSKVSSCDSIVLADIIWRIGRFFLDDGKPKEATELLIKAIGGFETVEDGRHRTILAKAHLGRAAMEQGHPEKAIDILEPLSKIAISFLGPEDLDTFEVLSRLAWVYANHNRLEEAVNLQEKVLEAGTRLLGVDDPETLSAMIALASSYRRQNKCVDAEKLEVKVLEARTRLFGEEHPDTLVAMGNLASTYKRQNKLKDAWK